MLTQETKQKINTARDILVGKIPDPKAQVEQITTALIYKFMDDMDKESEEVGGKRSFFTGDYEQYSWTKLLDSRLGNQDRLNLYNEATAKMPQNPNLPQLFRNIFKGYFLPYRDPETLSLFLKKINEFKYDHSEELGNAFEYLLSIMSSQGDAGQFRTPRHIIDFIVKVVDPKKDESILDPACGTAGFLISAYKHILEQNSNKQLNPDEKARLMKNIVGYDISPDMVKLSLVNLYLHGFPDPKILEYDTLTSEEKWNDSYDVILANPPFMTPKGGIVPHKKFKVRANKSEILFVDYITEHLSVDGKAGIIVPEGIIFQSGTAYKELRRWLVEDGFLWAVVSLPAGIFSPYSGVKTSILFLDKKVASKTDSILFAKIEHDGFDLGAQRRANGKDDLPAVQNALIAQKNCLDKSTQVVTEGLSGVASVDDCKSCLMAQKSELKANDYNLSGERYRSVVETSRNQWQMVELGEVCDLLNGYAFKSNDYVKHSKTLNFRMSNIRPDGQSDINYNPRYLPDSFAEKFKDFLIEDNDVVIAMTDMASDPKILGVPTIVKKDSRSLLLNQRVGKFTKINVEKLNIPFLKHVLTTEKVRGYYKLIGSGGVQINISKKDILKIQIPLPPLEVQKQIVAEIDGYQKIIDGAKQIVNNWKPKISINPSWSKIKIKDICALVRGSSPRPKGDKRYYGGNVPRLMVSDVTRDGMYVEPKIDFLTIEGAKLSRPIEKNTVVMAVSGNPGLPSILTVDACIHDGFVAFKNLSKEILPEYFYYVLLHNKDVNNSQSVGAVFRNLTTDQIKQFDIPVPSLLEQKTIINELSEEANLVNSSKQLIVIYEEKINKKIQEVWGESN